jgi:hypothetical protein
MGTSNWKVDLTVVAGADLSAHQYRNVNLSGVLAASADNIFGVLQNKPDASGQPARVAVGGATKIYFPTSLGKGALIMQSNATSGVIALASSGYCAFGQIINPANSGSIGTAWLFGGALKRLLA